MRLFRPFDGLIVIVIITAAVFSIGLTDTQKGARAEIYVDNRKVASYNLDVSERTTEIDTPIGAIQLQYGNGAIAIIRSPCKQRICVLQGAIHHTHERVICVPARTQIIITGEKTNNPEPPVDAFSY